MKKSRDTLEIQQNTILNDVIGLIRIYLGADSSNHWPKGSSEEEIFIQARLLGLLPILQANPVRETFSSEFRQSLKRAFLFTAAHYSRSARHMAEILADFAARKIAIIPFKGMVLSQMLYGDPSFRSSSDLDFMIRSMDVVPATAALQECGYELCTPLVKKKMDRIIGRTDYLEFENPENGVLVDLQWLKAKSYCPGPLAEEELFHATRMMDFASEQIVVFSGAVTLYLLCAHGARNSWCELRALVDLAMAMNNWDGTVWCEAAAMMHDKGIATMMSSGVLLAHQLFGIAIPAVVEPDINRKAIKLSEKIRHHWQRVGFERPNAWERFYWDLFFRERWWEKARYLLFRMQPTKADLIDGKSTGLMMYARRAARILTRNFKPESLSNGA